MPSTSLLSLIPSPRRLALPLLLAAGSAGCSQGLGDFQAGIDPTAMDRRADPCEDFYRYACGGFIDNNPIPAGAAGSIIARGSKAYFATEEVERAILAEASTSGAEGAALAAYHEACSHAGNGTQDMTAFNDAIARIDGVATPADLAAAVAAVHALGRFAFFSFGSTRNLASPGKLIASVGEAGVPMPDPSYYLDPNRAELAAYRDHVGNLSALLGIYDLGMVDAVVGIETKLAAAMLSSEEQRDPSLTFHLQDRATFEASVPSFDWATYRAAVGAPEYEALDVSVPDYFVTLESVLATTPMDDLKRYLRFRAAEALAFAMGDLVLTEEYAFHYGVFYGFSALLPRDEYCLRQTAGALPWAMSRAYVDRAFDGETRATATLVASAIRGALRADLAALPWLDKATRSAAIAKLDAMRVGIGAPDSWPSLAGLTIDEGSFVNAAAAVSAFDFKARVSGIGKDDTDVWFMPPVTVNAAYAPGLNTVNLPAAILQAPYFHKHYAPAVQFGAMGSIIAHELTHGFDDQGRRFDPSGKLGNWWTEQDEAEFGSRAQCLVDRYGAISPLPGEPIDGELTLGENIADLGGVKIAYAAALPGDEGDELTDKQAFFVAYAQAFCSVVRPELLRTILHSDPHAPDDARVNEVLAQTPEFAAAFSCEAGARMAPASRCAVW